MRMKKVNRHPRSTFSINLETAFWAEIGYFLTTKAPLISLLTQSISVTSSLWKATSQYIVMPTNHKKIRRKYLECFRFSTTQDCQSDIFENNGKAWSGYLWQWWQGWCVHTPNKKLSLFSTQEGSLSGSKQQGKCRGHDAMTLQEKFEDFTKIQIEAATKATCLQALIGHSSQH